MDSQALIDLPDLPGIGEGWELLLAPEERERRRCTGGNTIKSEAQREAIIASCVQLGTRKVAERFGVSREVVRALRREAIMTGKLDRLKEEMGRQALGASDLVLDRMIDEIDDLPKSELATAYRTLTDRGLLMTGQPTQHIQHTVTTTHESLNDWIDDLPSAEVVPVDTTPATPEELVYSGEKAHQKSISNSSDAGDQVAGDEVGSQADPVGDDRTSDNQSPVSGDLSEVADQKRADDGHNQVDSGGGS